MGFPGGSDGKESAYNAGDLGLLPGSGRSPWKRELLPTPVFLPGEFHGQRSLVDYSPRSLKESNTTECLTLSLSQTNTVWFRFCEVPRLVQFVESESTLLDAEAGEWRQSFSLGRWKIWEMGDGESCTIVWAYLLPLKCTVECGLKQYILCYVTFTTILKKH